MSYGSSIYDSNGAITLSTDETTTSSFIDTILTGVTTTTTTNSNFNLTMPESSCNIYRQYGREPSNLTISLVPSQTGVARISLVGGKRRSAMNAPYAWNDFLFANDAHMSDKYLPSSLHSVPTTLVGLSSDDQDNDLFGAMLYNGFGSKIISEKFKSYSLIQEIQTVSVTSPLSVYTLGGSVSLSFTQNVTFPQPLSYVPLLFVKNTSVPVTLFDFVKDGNGKYIGAKIICSPAVSSYGWPSLDSRTTGTCSIRVYAYDGDVTIPAHGLAVYDASGVLTYHSGGHPLRVESTKIEVPIFVDAIGQYSGYGWMNIPWADAYSATIGDKWVALTGSSLVGCLTGPESLDFWYHREIFVGVFTYNNGGTAKLLLRPTATVRIYYYSGWICMLNYFNQNYVAWFATTT